MNATRKAERLLLDNRAAALAARVTEDKRLFGHMLHSTETAVAVLAADYDAHGASAGRVVKMICAIGLTVSAACFLAAAFLPLPARATEVGNTPQAMAIYGVDSKGGEWIMGAGDTCEAAEVNMVWPPVSIVETECAPYELESAR